MSSRDRRSRRNPQPQPPPPSPRIALFPRRELLLVIAVAVVFRLLYWALYSHTPFFRHPVVDGSFFDLWAQNIAAGEPKTGDVWFKPPLYAYWLGLVYRVCGHAPLVAYALQAAMGTGTAVLVLGIGRLAFTPRIALVGAVTAALLPILPFLELQLLAEPLTTLLSVAALFVLLLARQDDRWREGLLALSGLLLGVAVVGRPNVLLFLPAVAWWVWRGTPGDLSLRLSRRLRPAGIVLAVAGLALVPSTLRNYAAGQSLVPVSANFGINLWTGIYPGADGESPIHVGIHWNDIMLRCQLAGAVSPNAASTYYRDRAVRAMAADPLRTAGLLAKKAVLLVGAREIRNNIGPSFLAQEFGVITLHRWWPGFWLVGPFALLGLVEVRRRGAPGLLLALYLAALALSILPFFVNARFRAPMLPVLALFAAAGLEFLLAGWRTGGRRRLGTVAGLLACVLLVNVPWFPGSRARDDARDHHNLGTAYAARLSGQGLGLGNDNWRAQDPDLAREHSERAMALDPDEADYPESLGQLLMQLAMPRATRAQAAWQRGDREQAASDFEPVRPAVERAARLHAEAARLFPRSYRSWANLGLARFLLGEAASGEAAGEQYRAAVAAFEASLRVAPGNRATAQNLTVARRRLGYSTKNVPD